MELKHHKWAFDIINWVSVQWEVLNIFSVRARTLSKLVDFSVKITTGTPSILKTVTYPLMCISPAARPVRKPCFTPWWPSRIKSKKKPPWENILQIRPTRKVDVSTPYLNWWETIWCLLTTPRYGRLQKGTQTWRMNADGKNGVGNIFKVGRSCQDRRRLSKHPQYGPLDDLSCKVIQRSGIGPYPYLERLDKWAALTTNW